MMKFQSQNLKNLTVGKKNFKKNDMEKTVSDRIIECLKSAEKSIDELAKATQLIEPNPTIQDRNSELKRLINTDFEDSDSDDLKQEYSAGFKMCWSWLKSIKAI